MENCIIVGRVGKVAEWWICQLCLINSHSLHARYKEGTVIQLKVIPA